MKYIPLAALLATTLATAQDYEKLRVDVRPSVPSDGVVGPPIIIDDLGTEWAVKLDGTLVPAEQSDTIDPYSGEKVDARLRFAEGEQVEVEVTVTWEKLDTILRAKGFGDADTGDGFGSLYEIDQVASDIRAAVSGVAQAMERRPPSSGDFEVLRDAVRPAGLERFVDEAESNPFAELRELHDLWERIVDALLDRALEKYENAAANGRITRDRFNQIESLLSERAAAAQDDPLSADTYRRLAALMAQVEASDSEQDRNKRMQEYKLELFKERLKRVMSYLLIAAERGFVPAGWHERVADFMAHRARLGN